MAKPIKFEGQICPKCGSHLIIKESENGEFLACPRFPACKFTKPLPDGDIKIYSPPSPYCEKCNHTGLLPFIKNDKVIPHAFINCKCKQGEPERHQPITPADFDFPCSDAYRFYYFEQYAERDPGYIPPEPEAPPPQIIEHRHSDISKQEYARLQNLEGQVKYLQGKLTEREQKRTIRYEDYE